VGVEEIAQLDLGVLEGDTLEEFHQIRTPFLLPDGKLVVPLAGANTIRVFSANGEFVESLGRAGSGPGEFQDLAGAWPRGDTVEALDFELRRFVRFLPDGSTQEIEIQSDHPDVGIAGPLGEGWVIAGVADAAFGRRDQIAVRRIGRDGVDRGELTRVEGMARYRGADFRGPEPLSPTAVITVGDDAVFVGETLTPRLQVFDDSGVLKRELVWEATPVSVTTVYQAVLDSAVATAAPNRAATIRQRLAAAHIPDQLSVFWKVIVDERGFVWIRPYDPFANAFALGPRDGAGGSWTVLSPDGVSIGSVETPAGIEPAYITSNALVAIARDDLGVESVRVHSVRRQ
jgi:hypothetical protein